MRRLAVLAFVAAVFVAVWFSRSGRDSTGSARAAVGSASARDGADERAALPASVRDAAPSAAAGLIEAAQGEVVRAGEAGDVVHADGVIELRVDGSRETSTSDVRGGRFQVGAKVGDAVSVASVRLASIEARVVQRNLRVEAHGRVRVAVELPSMSSIELVADESGARLPHAELRELPLSDADFIEIADPRVASQMQSAPVAQGPGHVEVETRPFDQVFVASAGDRAPTPFVLPGGALTAVVRLPRAAALDIDVLHGVGTSRFGLEITIPADGPHACRHTRMVGLESERTRVSFEGLPAGARYRLRGGFALQRPEPLHVTVDRAFEELSPGRNRLELAARGEPGADEDPEARLWVRRERDAVDRRFLELARIAADGSRRAIVTAPLDVFDGAAIPEGLEGAGEWATRIRVDAGRYEISFRESGVVQQVELAPGGDAAIDLRDELFGTLLIAATLDGRPCTAGDLVIELRSTTDDGQRRCTPTAEFDSAQRLWTAAVFVPGQVEVFASAPSPEDRWQQLARASAAPRGAGELIVLDARKPPRHSVELFAERDGWSAPMLLEHWKQVSVSGPGRVLARRFVPERGSRAARSCVLELEAPGTYWLALTAAAGTPSIPAQSVVVLDSPSRATLRVE